MPFPRLARAALGRGNRLRLGESRGTGTRPRAGENAPRRRADRDGAFAARAQPDAGHVSAQRVLRARRPRARREGKLRARRQSRQQDFGVRVQSLRGARTAADFAADDGSARAPESRGQKTRASAGTQKQEDETQRARGVYRGTAFRRRFEDVPEPPPRRASAYAGPRDQGARSRAAASNFFDPERTQVFVSHVVKFGPARVPKKGSSFRDSTCRRANTPIRPLCIG